MTRWSLFLQTLSLLHHFLGLYLSPAPEEVAAESADQSVCIGELVIERQATHQEVVEVSQTLKEVLNADIFSVKPTSDGVSISCRVRDASSFLSSLPDMPKVTAWAVAYP